MFNRCGKEKVYVPDTGCNDCDLFRAELEEVKEKNSEQDGRLSTLESEDNDLKDRVANLESDNTQSKGRIGALEEITTNYGSRIAGVENRASELENCCSEVQQTLEDYDARITANRLNIQTVDAKFANYYPKTEVYTQSQVDHLISQIETGGYEEVNQLPAVGDPNIIYLVPRQGGGYERWIYSNNTWKDLGGMEIDLSEYVKITDIPDMIHPVGDTVIRFDNVNPGTLYTGTTWQKVSEGRMLIGANSTYTLGSTGGSATHSHTNPTTNGSSAANTGAASGNTGTSSGSTGGASTETTSGSSAANTGTNTGNTGNASPATGGASTETTSGSSAANTGSTTLTSAQSGVPAHSHGSGTLAAIAKSLTGKFRVRKTLNTNNQAFATAWNNSGIITGASDVSDAVYAAKISGVQNGANYSTDISIDASHDHSLSGSTGNNTAANASSGHTHTMAHTHTHAHTHTVNSHYHSLNSHAHTMAHTHTHAHTHSLNSHTHSLNSHSHTMAHTHTQNDTGSSSNMPPYIAVNIWLRTA